MSFTYSTPARVMACMTPTFNLEEMGVASSWSEAAAIIAAMPAGYRFAHLRPVTSKSPNDAFRTDLDYRAYVNPPAETREELAGNAAEIVAAWSPTVSPREQALRAIIAENPEGNDRVTASIILDAREAAAAREDACAECDCADPTCIEGLECSCGCHDVDPLEGLATTTRKDGLGREYRVAESALNRAEFRVSSRQGW